MRQLLSRIRLLATLLSGVLLVLTGCSPTPPAKPVLLVFGDSVTVLSESQAQFLLGGKYTLVFRAMGGSALCDWIPESAFDKAYYRPSRVVIAFTGNNLSPCAAHAYAAGGEPGLIANYRTALQQMHSAFTATPMTVLAAPASRPATPGHPAPPNGDPQAESDVPRPLRPTRHALRHPRRRHPHPRTPIRLATSRLPGQRATRDRQKARRCSRHPSRGPLLRRPPSSPKPDRPLTISLAEVRRANAHGSELRAAGTISLTVFPAVCISRSQPPGTGRRR